MGVSFKQIAAAIRSLVSSGTLQELLEEILTRGKDRRSELHRFYRNCVERISVKGFRRGAEPHLQLLLPRSVQAVSKHDGALMDFLCAFLTLEQRRVEQVRDVIRGLLGDEPEPPETVDAFMETVRRLTDEVRGELDDGSDEERLRLLVAATLVIPPFDQLKHQQEDSAAAMEALELPSMAEALEVIRGIDAQDPFWAHLDTFVQQVQAIGKEKRDAGRRRDEVDQALGSLVKEHGDYLSSFFGLSVSNWSSERLLPEQLDFVLEQLEPLVSDLCRYRELESQRPADVKEAKEQRRQLAELEEEISTRWTTVNECFLTDGAEPQPEEPGREVELGEADPGQMETTDGEAEALEQKEAPLDEERVAQDEGEPEGSAEQQGQLEESEKKSETETGAKPEEAPEGTFSEAETVPEKDEHLAAKIWHKDMLVDMLEVGDLAGAYWLARSREERQMETPLPSWLLAAMESVRYLLKPGFRFAKQFTYPNAYYLHETNRFAELCAVGAGLMGALLEPASNSRKWLQVELGLPNVQKIIELVKGFDKHAISLSRRDVLLRASAEQREKMIRTAAGRCKELLNANVQRRFGLPRVSIVWKQLFADGQELRQALEWAASDRRGQLQAVSRILEEWSTDKRILERIADIDLKHKRRKDRPLQTYELERLKRIVNEVVNAAQEWTVLVEHGGERRDFKQVQIQQFKNQFGGYLEPCLQELDAAQKVGGLERLAYRYIAENLNLLKEYLTSTEEPFAGRREWVFALSESLEQMLAKRLLWCPNLSLDDQGLPTADDLDQLVDCLQPRPNWDLLTRDLYDAWLKKEDYRFMDSLVEGLDEDEEVKDSLREKGAQNLQGSRDALEEMIRATAVQIESTFINVGLTEEKHSELKARVEEIDSATTANFAPTFRRLKRIQQELDEERQRRVQHQQQLWAELSPRLGEASSAEEAEQFRALVEQAMVAGDTRVADELISRARDCLEKRKPLVVSGQHEGARDYLREFSQFRQALDREKDASLSRARRAAESGTTWSGLNYGAIPRPQLEVIKDAFAAWRRLSRRERMGPSLVVLLEFLGFTVAESVGQKLRMKDERGHIHLSLKMTASDQARPFPQFGSMPPSFNIVLVWERSGADNLGTAIKEAKLGAESTIVLYFGRIQSEVSRREITRMSRRSKLSLAVLDEALFLFLTGERDARLRAFLRCAVPYGTTIPYTPEMMGDVPREIFYGREQAANMLRRREGSCLVYGGRQMGKSALLNYVQRQAHNPERRQYAWVEDIKPLGDRYSNQEPSRIWWRLWHLLSTEGLLSGQPKNDEEIVLQVGGLFRKYKELQILLLLDEADNFLNHDSKRGFKVVTALRKLMVESERRFKVVFAGLNHVQRFQSLPNQPLAHFGVPILVGPLEERDAVQLVREPIEALGFKVEDDCIYRILSFTNYHPGLIQFFCYHLLQRMYEKHEELPFPYRPIEVTKEDVEHIYLQPDVRDRIKERFEWTLALDPRYQVIIWAMIVAQLDMRDSFSQEFSVRELQALAREYWPAEFKGMGSDAFRGLLTELVGLGVLTETRNRYRLKSPNLVRLMGTESDIFNRLVEFEDRPALEELESDSYHARIDVERDLYSIFTYSQARSINRRHDFRVITVSRTLGLDYAESSIRELYAAEPNTSFKRLSSSVVSADELQRALDKELDKAKKAGRDHIVFYQIITQTQNLPLEAMKAAYAHYQSALNQERRRTVSFFFVLNPPAYWGLRKEDADFMDDLDAEGRIVSINPWNDWGIGQRLDNEDKLNNAETRQAVLKAGGRWPCLLDEIMHKCASSRDVRHAAQEVSQELKGDEDLRQRFRRQLELPDEPALGAVLGFLLSEKEPVPLECINPSFGELLSQLRDEECRETVELLLRFGLADLEDDSLVLDTAARMVLT